MNITISSIKYDLELFHKLLSQKKVIITYEKLALSPCTWHLGSKTHLRLNAPFKTEVNSIILYLLKTSYVALEMCNTIS